MAILKSDTFTDDDGAVLSVQRRQIRNVIPEDKLYMFFQVRIPFRSICKAHSTEPNNKIKKQGRKKKL